MTESTLAGVLEGIPFAVELGITIESATPEQICGSMPWAPERCTSGGILHGGALMAFADTLGAVCAFLNLPDGAGTATVESKTNFFRGVRDSALHGLSRRLHKGRSFIVVQTDLTDDAGKLVGQTTQTQAVLAPRA